MNYTDYLIHTHNLRGRPRERDMSLEISDMFVSLSILPKPNSFLLKQNKISPSYFKACMRFILNGDKYKRSIDW